MGKASDRSDAEHMLRCLRGRVHRVTTAMALCRYGDPDQETLSDEEGLAVTTEVRSD